MPFEIVRNDITKMQVDAIVNAANASLMGGGGVDGAIHRAAGPDLDTFCRKLGGCTTGDAKVTPGFGLPCRIIIHTVGPIWQGGGKGEKAQLASCYRRSLELAERESCESVAFPLISAGTYGYPREQALQVAVDTIRGFLQSSEMVVYLVVYDRASFDIGRERFANIRAWINDNSIPSDYELMEARRCASNRKESASLDWIAMTEAMSAPSSFPDTAPHHSEISKREDKPKLTAKKPSLFDRIKKRSEEKSVDSIEKEQRDSLEDFLRQTDEGFRDMLLRKIDEEGMTDAECYKRANIDRKLFNKIKNQLDYRPGKNTVLALAVSLRLPMPEVREMLTKAGYSLTHSSKADLIVEYFLIHGNYDIYEINEALFAFDQRLLGSSSL